MNTNNARHILGGILVIVLGMWYFSLADSAISSPQDIVIMPTPTGGAPTPAPVPQLTERVLAYLIEKYSLSKEQIIANGFKSYYLPHNWSGNALGVATVTAVNTLADGPAVDIAVIVNHSVSSPPSGADLAHSYTGINR